jgi:putative transposase
MSVREIREHLEELYQVEVTPSLISAVTDEVMEEVTAWQQRPLESCYAVVMFDCLRVKIRDEGVVRNKAVYVALGVTRTGSKEVLGLWIEQTEGARFWHRVLTELQGRGVADILIALIDGLTGFPEALTAVFPQAQIHTCIVHLVRRSLAYTSGGRSATGWPPRCGRFTGPRPSRRRKPRWRPSQRVPTGSPTRRLPRSGSGPGPT